MRVIRAACAPIFSLCLAFAAQAEPVTTSSVELPEYLSNHISNPAVNCIVQGAAVEKSENTDMLLAVRAEAQHLTEMGTYLLEMMVKAQYPTCAHDDPENMGTNRHAVFESDNGQGLGVFNTISTDLSAYPRGLSEDEIFSYRVLGFLEESAHAFTSTGLRMNSGYEMKIYAGLFSPIEVVKKMWADEALASTAALIALRQQAEKGHDKHWNVIKDFPSYSSVIEAIDQSAQDDPNNLYNGEAFIEGFVAWYNTPALKYTYASRVADAYSSRLQSHKANNFAVDRFDFESVNIVHMAAGLNAHAIFYKYPSVVDQAMTDWGLSVLPDELVAKIKQLESETEAYRVSQLTPVN